jgi:hypothetical protein
MFYKTDYKPPSSVKKYNSKQPNNPFRWSIDISNMYKKSDDEYYILIAISRINPGEDMKKEEGKESSYIKRCLSKKKFKSPELEDGNDKGRDLALDMPTESENKRPNSSNDNTSKPEDKIKKGVAIYRLEFKKMDTENEMGGNYVLNAVTLHYSDNISGICKFIEVSNEDEDEGEGQSRFIILNFHGIYNFKFNKHFDFFNLNEKFNYPQSMRHKIDKWYNKGYLGCLRRLLSSIYDKYFLVTQYKNHVQSIEGKLLFS